jgi:hypothetical protein
MTSGDLSEEYKQTDEEKELRLVLLREVGEKFGFAALAPAQAVLKEMPPVNSPDFSIREFYVRLETELNKQ